MPRLIATLAVLTLCVLVSDCGGGPYTRAGGGTTNAAVGGVWDGLDPVSRLAMAGLVDEAGHFNFIRSDGVQYVGTAVANGTTLTASFDGYMPLGQSFPDGSRHGHGTLTGTVEERVSITVTLQFTTDVGTTSSGMLDLAFDATYKVPSSLATLAGNYTDQASGDVISVTSNGAVTWQDANSGCVGNGTVSIINATYNLYQLTFDYANCTGSSVVLNGGQFTGLVTLNTAVSPDHALAGTTGTVGGATYSLVFNLNRS